ncbi:MAG: ectoine/hydroxyectoine ABC transporter permease subunit EhuD [Thermacetogeniaceae bacterium]|jgi:polar amino acid transport system permease protein|nr:ectoine/hydroxyectoine ABC transporter permease subunit EhuD [Thermoanaerobacterales bacterium]NLN21359.1 ectoine/hydroxyectoine ABC transporter permease subunit EhuD [Syntrophomonadaceae bacterium]
MWDWEFTISILPLLFEGLKITLIATFLAFGFAVVMGLLLAIARRSSVKILSLPVKAFIEFVRSTPPLAQLFFIFYVFPKFGLVLTPLVAGVLGLGLHYSTYLSEVYRSGIDSIPRGQWEAAKALNFSKARTWISIIIPQAVPPIIPVMGNYLIGMFKDTPLLSAITLVEVLQTAKIIGAQSFRYLEPITMVGVIFLILSYVSSLGVQWLELRLNQR